MVINNISSDIHEKMIEAGYNQNQIAKELHRSRQYINTVCNGQISLISKSIVNVFELLGYDIEIRYVKKNAD